MKKIELKDVLHLYVGSKSVFLKSGRIITVRAYHIVHGWFDGVEWYSPAIWNYRLLLRPISSLTDAEKCELYAMSNDGVKDESVKWMCFCTGKLIEAGRYSPAQFIYLLSLSIDMFDLITSGQAEKIEGC